MPLKECFYGLMVEQIPDGKGFTVYTNQRENLKRSFLKIKIPV
jgi:hypothetical protein